METDKVYCPGITPASGYAARYLEHNGWSVLQKFDPSVKHILLDIPSIGPGRPALCEILPKMLPSGTVVYGGKLSGLTSAKCVDFLEDPYYLAKNAAITADCAIRIAAPLLKQTFSRLPVLIIGWGRIGKCLACALRELGAEPIVSARSDQDLAILQALGYRSISTYDLNPVLTECALVFNTVPQMMLTEQQTTLCRDCILMDLASEKGICGENVIWARGLPGIHAPVSSGELIAKTFLKYVKEEKS